jgi:Xaa-Pro aminopeptidase
MTKAPQVLQERLSSVREYLGAKRLDGLLISSRVDQVYLTGFTGEDGMVLVTPQQVYLLSDFRFKTAAREQAAWARFVTRKKGIAEELAKVVRRIGISRIGVVPERITVAAGRELRKMLRPAGGRLVYVRNPVADLREKKDAAEIALIRKAVNAAEEAFRAVRRSIRPGQTELELASRLNYEMGRRGAAGPSFPTIVAEGPNSALPHAEPGGRAVRSGSAVLFDWGACVGGYCSDLTRVVFIDKIPPQFRRVYGVVLEAQQRAIRGVRAGRSIRRLDAVARSYITQCGHGKEFGHSLGHGLGLDVHEPPSLNARNKARLESGMVVTIEPGVYLPGIGGVRIEDNVLVRDGGCEVLTTLPRDLEWAVVRL